MGFTLHQSTEKEEAPFDFAFNCTANASALQYCIDQLGFEGQVVELSWYGNREVNLQLGGSFHQQRKQIISSQVGHLPRNRKARWDFQRRKKLVFQLLQNPLFDQQINRVIALEEAPAFFDQIRRGENQELGIAIEYKKKKNEK